MEMGDKTQVATVFLATASDSLAGTLLGAWLALTLLAVIGAFAGDRLAGKLPKLALDGVSACLFLLVGTLVILLA